MRRQIYRSLTALGLLLALATPAFAAQERAAAARPPAPGVWEELSVFVRLAVWVKTGWVGRAGMARPEGGEAALGLKWGAGADPDGLAKPATAPSGGTDWGLGVNPDGLSGH